MKNYAPRTPLDNQDCSVRQESTIHLIMSSLLNRPLTGSKNRNFHNEAKSKTFSSPALRLAFLWNRGLGKLGNGLATQLWQGGKSFFFPWNFNSMLAVYFFWLTFWGKSSVIKFTNWMYLFPMNKSASCLPSRTTYVNLTDYSYSYYCVAQNTQMIHKTNEHFALHKNSNTSLHLIALKVQSIELIPTKVLAKFTLQKVTL